MLNFYSTQEYSSFYWDKTAARLLQVFFQVLKAVIRNTVTKRHHCVWVVGAHVVLFVRWVVANQRSTAQCKLLPVGALWSHLWNSNSGRRESKKRQNIQRRKRNKNQNRESWQIQLYKVRGETSCGQDIQHKENQSNSEPHVYYLAHSEYDFSSLLVNHVTKLYATHEWFSLSPKLSLGKT